HTRWPRDWSSDVCSSDLVPAAGGDARIEGVAFFDQDLEGPDSIRRDGKARGAVAGDRRPGDVFQDGLGGADVGAELGRRLRRDEIGRASCRERAERGAWD